MIKWIFAATLSMLLLASFGWAQQVQPGADTANQASNEQSARQTSQDELDALILTMAEEMEVIRNTKDGKQRQTLMTEHRENMREAMAIMREMDGSYMQTLMAEHMTPSDRSEAESSRPRHVHKRTVPPKPRSGMSVSDRLTDLEIRLDMMLVMMEFMLDDQLQQ